MSLAERYAQFREGSRLREVRPSMLGKFSELEIQARWFAGEFGKRFKTTAGDELEIIQLGVWNREAGPDFSEAAISLNGAAPIRGCIELDTEARDWERHGHVGNPDYENVVLHIFSKCGLEKFFTHTAENRDVPQLFLDLSRLEHGQSVPAPIAKPGRCVAPLRDFPRAKIIELLDAAARFRMCRKSAAFSALSAAHGTDEALYQSLAQTLGYKANKLPFTLLAQRLPLRLMRTNKNDAEALLFGVSGFLAAKDFSRFDSATRSYLRELWERWWKRRGEFERLALPENAWSLSGSRPANHPQRRLVALAQIARSWSKLRALADSCETSSISKFFAALHDEYWDFHFTLTSAPARARMALVGRTRVTEMLANVFFPRAMLDDERQWNHYRKLPAALTNKRVQIAALRLFAGESADLLRTVARQQGLLQIYEDFCMQDNSDCAQCQFPTQLRQWR